MALEFDFQLIVMAGRNAAALARLQALTQRFPGRLLALGYTGQVARLMACSDIAITKPGGLTVSECLAMGLPMILNAPVPGQEERNADYLLEQGAALKANDAATLHYRIGELLGNPGKLAAMRSRAAGQPRSAGPMPRARWPRPCLLCAHDEPQASRGAPRDGCGPVLDAIAGRTVLAD